MINSSCFVASFSLDFNFTCRFGKSACLSIYETRFYVKNHNIVYHDCFRDHASLLEKNAN